MASGREQHEARLQAIKALGRDLSRRAGSRCELCQVRDRLDPVEVAPVERAPSLERLILLCWRCVNLVEGGSLNAHNPDELRFLAEAMWSETLPVQLTAVRSLRRLQAAGIPWADEALEQLYLPEEKEKLL